MSTSRSAELADQGGHFYRADFQVHTPRDTQWDGDRPSLADRQAWAQTFVAAARAKDLHAVAISDHHDFAFFPYIKKAAAEEKLQDGSAVPDAQRLVVFPALEVTLSVPCQAILILDADFPEDRLDDVLKAMHFDPIDPSLDKLPQTQPLADSGDINELLDKLDKHDWLRGHYILLPNVTPNGHKTLLRTSFQAKYSAMSAVGGYLDGSITELDKKKHVGEKRILELDTTWGSKRLALFQTSDARKSDLSPLGEHSTWVKWSAPTAEALRQACLAAESRLAQAEPAMPSAWISRVMVSNSKFMSRVDVALNPQYTALIGGRGTGKSTILDYLRWALCDQPAESGDEDEVANPRVRQRRLIDATLKPLDAHVEVHCLINGIPHVVRRYAADGSVQLKVGDAEFEKVREANIQSLLPIQAYSQKQLSSVAIRVDELLRFVTSPIQRKLEDVDRRTQEIAGRLRENYGTLQRHRTLTTEIERTDLRARSLSNQAKALRDGLAGISEDDRKVLDSKAGHDGVRAANSVWQQQVEGLQHSVSDLLVEVDTALESLVRPDVVPEAVASETDSALSATRTALTDLRTGLLAVGQGFGRAGEGDGALAASVGALVAKLDAFDTEYAAVKDRSSAHEEKLNELTGLEEQQKAALDLGQRQKKERDGLGDPVEQHKKLRAELIAVRTERTDALAEQCAALSTSSDGTIRAQLSTSAGFGDAQEKFKGLIQGSNVRGSRLSDFFDQLAQESNPASTWEAVLAELEQLMLLEPDADVKSEETPVLSRLGIPVADQKRLAPKLTPDGWLDLSLTVLSDVPQFEYKAKEGEYIPFDSASAGQQASALLATLLSQTGTPLIIDQPEDDLDSDTVQQIVTRIWDSKSGRQLIFSSHNANLVVNGDADLVLVCAYVNSGDQSAGHIKQQGAIDVAAVRDEITSVMEGGEKAFRLRKEKYGF
jgi:type III restriction enzyme